MLILNVTICNDATKYRQGYTDTTLALFAGDLLCVDQRV